MRSTNLLTYLLTYLRHGGMCYTQWRRSDRVTDRCVLRDGCIYVAVWYICSDSGGRAWPTRQQKSLFDPLARVANAYAVRTEPFCVRLNAFQQRFRVISARICINGRTQSALPRLIELRPKMSDGQKVWVAKCGTEKYENEKVDVKKTGKASWWGSGHWYVN